MLKIIALAAAAALIGTTPAAASDADEALSAQVRIDDLDLTDGTDQQRLDRRIATAARRICADATRGVIAMQREQRCVALALEQAAPQADRAIALAQGDQRLARIDMTIAG